jgi:hypothetical protein
VGIASTADAAAPPPSVAAPPEATENARVRFDVAGSAVFGLAHPAAATAQGTGALASGLVLDFGVQIDDAVAAYVRGEFASILFSNQLAAYVIAEWTPRRWISIGTGFGYDAMLTAYTPAWGGPSVPLVLGFNFGRTVAPGARRRVLRLGLEAAGGIGGLEDGPSSVFGWHTALSFGGAWM